MNNCLSAILKYSTKIIFREPIKNEETNYMYKDLDPMFLR
jgi:hypothetical protein